MNTHLIGRQSEIALLERFLNSDKPEFLALYGRRRVGKTYLVKQFFKQKDVLFFNSTGEKKASLAKQIKHFTQQMSRVFLDGLTLEAAKDWDSTFDKLTTLIDRLPEGRKIVLFFDEFPWMVTRKSQLLESLDYYWNQFWSDNPKIKLIICGSAASWIVQKIVQNKGGLHNRLTEKIRLEPFSLAETKIYLHSHGIALNDRQILQIYMLTGGVPYYLTKVKPGRSAAQVIEDLAFSKNAFFIDEFELLFSSLFKESAAYIAIVKKIAAQPNGIGKSALLNEIGALGGGGTSKLQDLEETGFIIKFKPLYHKSKGTFYKLIDEYTIFYLKWIEPIRDSLQFKSLEPGNWLAVQNTPQWYSWLGLAFEAVCYKHISAIRKALGVNPTAIAGAWRYTPIKGSMNQGAQIDLLFDRKDDAITICEIKYSEEPYVLTKEYMQILIRKIDVFKNQTKTQKQIFLALICAQGVKNSFYAESLVSGVVTLEDLFKPI